MEEEVIELNKWIDELHPWCPAQLSYYFEDHNNGRWCISLRWDGPFPEDPWTAELIRCDEVWDFRWESPDTVDLLKEEHHTPGIRTNYYMMDEYPYLQQKALELVRERFPDLKDELI